MKKIDNTRVIRFADCVMTTEQLARVIGDLQSDCRDNPPSVGDVVHAFESALELLKEFRQKNDLY